MDKNKIYDLLSEGKIADAVSTLLEKLEGPALDNEAKELENEATEENGKEPEVKEVENDDVYPNDEHKEVEEVKEVVVESAENEATEERTPETMEQNTENDEVYPADEHKEKEDISEQLQNIYEFLVYSEDDEFEGFLESLDRINEYEICEYLLSENYEEVLNEASGRKIAGAIQGGVGTAALAGAAHNIGAGVAKGTLGAKMAGAGTALASSGALPVAAGVGGALAAGAGLYHLGKKVQRQVAIMKDLKKRKKVSIKKADGSDDKYDYRNRNLNRKEALTQNKLKHLDSITAAREDLKFKKKHGNAKEVEAAKYQLAKNKAQYFADKKKIKYADKLKRKLARLSAARDYDDKPYTKKPEKTSTADKEQSLVDNKPVVVTESVNYLLEASDIAVMEWLYENGYETSIENIKELRTILEEIEAELVNEDILDSNPEAEKVEDLKFENPTEVAPTGERTYEEEAPKATETAEELEKVLELEPTKSEPELELSESMKSIFAILDSINEECSSQLAAGPELKEPKELENEATEENKAEEVAEEKDNKDVYPNDEHKEVEEVKEVVVEAVENEATEERAPETMEQEVDNKDVYNAPEHKEVEDVVEVVVEAAKLCGENGVPATLENITRFAKTLFESESVALNVSKPEEKEYDVDAAIESAEMNGNKEEFKEYEDIQGEGAEAAKAEESVVEPADLHESVKYTSLREACLLDEDYFTTDSYTIQTADEKYNRLTEQVALLMAREAMDPLYDELLQASIKAQRLQEACCKKYRKKATQQVNENIVPERLDEEGLINFLNELALNPEALNEGKLGNFFIRTAIKFLGRKNLDKILTSAKQKLSGKELNNKGNSLLAKVDAALRSSDKVEKRTVIREFLDMADEKTLAEADAKLKNYSKQAKNNPKTLKESLDELNIKYNLFEATDYGYASDTTYGDTGLTAYATGDQLKATFGTHGDRSGYDAWQAGQKLITAGSVPPAVATFLGMAGPQAFIVGLIVGIIASVITVLIVKKVRDSKSF